MGIFRDQNMIKKSINNVNKQRTNKEAYLNARLRELEIDPTDRSKFSHSQVSAAKEDRAARSIDVVIKDSAEVQALAYKTNPDPMMNTSAFAAETPGDKGLDLIIPPLSQQ